MKRKLRLSPGLTAFAIGAFYVSSCRKPVATSAVRVEQAISPWPARVGPAIVTLKLTDADGNPVTGARVKLEGDMAHPGMRPEFGDASEIEPGRYRGRLVFTMAGDWVMLVLITLPNGKTIERQLDVTGVRAN